MFVLSLQWLVLALDTLLKAALLAVLAAAALKASGTRDSNVRHRVWTGVLIGMLALPLVARIVPALRLPLPVSLDRLAIVDADEPAVDEALDSSHPSDSVLSTEYQVPNSIAIS